MIAVCIPLFVAYIRYLDRSLIRPYLTRLNDRDSLTTGAGSSAEGVIKDAIALEEKTAQQVADSRSRAIQGKLQKINTARDEAARIVERAEQEVAAQVSAERARVKAQIESQRSVLVGDVDSLASDIVKKILAPSAYAAVLVIISAMNPGHAFASGAGESHGYGYLFWYWINFLLYVGVMYLLLKGMIAKGWSARREKIQNDIEAGKRSLESAMKRFDSAKSRASVVESEITAMLEGIERETDGEVKKILADAERHATEIKKSATQNLTQEGKAQKESMQREIADLVLARAEDMLKSSLTKDKDKSLRDAAITGLQAAINQVRG
jgi:F0F1-type ATP synthase membrane subunit b/b'